MALPTLAFHLALSNLIVILALPTFAFHLALSNHSNNLGYTVIIMDIHSISSGSQPIGDANDDANDDEDSQMSILIEPFFQQQWV